MIDEWDDMSNYRLFFIHPIWKGDFVQEYSMFEVLKIVEFVEECNNALFNIITDE